MQPSLGQRKRAVLGDISTSERMALRARATLHDSSSSASANRKATLPASNHSPSPIAPAIAIVISRFMSGRRRFAANHAFGTTYHTPAITAAMYKPSTSGG